MLSCSTRPGSSIGSRRKGSRSGPAASRPTRSRSPPAIRCGDPANATAGSSSRTKRLNSSRCWRRPGPAFACSTPAPRQAAKPPPLPFSQSFDSVLVDVPCSGLGTLRRDPDIRWRRRESDLRALASAELIMLGHAADVVAPGGRLIYATCSSEPEENDDVVNAFLTANTGFMRLDARIAAPRLAPEVVDDQGFLRTEPDRHEL